MSQIPNKSRIPNIGAPNRRTFFCQTKRLDHKKPYRTLRQPSNLKEGSRTHSRFICCLKFEKRRTNRPWTGIPERETHTANLNGSGDMSQRRGTANRIQRMNPRARNLATPHFRMPFSEKADRRCLASREKGQVGQGNRGAISMAHSPSHHPTLRKGETFTLACDLGSAFGSLSFERARKPIERGNFGRKSDTAVLRASSVTCTAPCFERLRYLQNSKLGEQQKILENKNVNQGDI